MAKEPEERSPSGAPIYRHDGPGRDFVSPEHSAEHLEEVEAHVEKHIGKVESVWHEILSDFIHLDLLFVPATEKRPYHVVVTSGVSDEPMTVPDGMEGHRRVELLMALPPDWPLSQADMKDEKNYWPLRWLKMVGRLPHQHRTWIGWGHTIPNGDPAELLPGTKFVGVMLLPAFHLPADFFCFKSASGETIQFYALTPLYAEEMDLKLRKGSEEIEKRFEKQDIGMVLDINRPNVALKRGWFRW